MNFYKHHIGDYAQATAHLSFVEDAAYSRLIRKVYADEKPLPPDLKAVQRLVGARTREEKDAVQSVLEEFFEQRADGWHNKRCDVELAKANAQAEANRRVAEEREARRRARREQEERDASFHASSGETHESLPPGEHESLPSREPSQTPDTRLQTPDLKTGEQHAPGFSPTAGASVCLAVKRAGIAGCNPSDPRLLALLARGATVDHFVGAVEAAKAKRSPWAYLLATVEGQILEAAQLAQGPQATTRQPTRADQRAETIAGLTGATRERTAHADRDAGTAIDVESRTVD